MTCHSIDIDIDRERERERINLNTFLNVRFGKVRANRTSVCEKEFYANWKVKSFVWLRMKIGYTIVMSIVDMNEASVRHRTV